MPTPHGSASTAASAAISTSRLSQVVCAAAYLTCSVSLTVFNKFFVTVLRAPLSVTAIHMMAVFFVASVLRGRSDHLQHYYGPTSGGVSAHSSFHSRRAAVLPTPFIAFGIAPIAVLTACDFGMSNTSLMLITMTLYTLIKSAGPALTLVVAVMLRLERLTLALVLVMLLIVGGSTYATTEDLRIHEQANVSERIGVALVVVAIACGAFRSNWSHLILHSSMTPESTAPSTGTGGSMSGAGATATTSITAAVTAAAATHPNHTTNAAAAATTAITAPSASSSSASAFLAAAAATAAAAAVSAPSSMAVSSSSPFLLTGARSGTGDMDRGVNVAVFPRSAAPSLLSCLPFLVGPLAPSLGGVLATCPCTGFGHHGPISTVDLLFYMTPICALALLPFAYFLEFNAWRDFAHAAASSGASLVPPAPPSWSYLAFLIFVGGVLALALNFSEYLFLSRFSGLTLSVTAVSKEIVLIGIAVAVFGDRPSGRTLTGFCICLTGILFYQQYKLRAKGIGAAVHPPLPPAFTRDGGTDVNVSDLGSVDDDDGNDNDGNDDDDKDDDDKDGRRIVGQYRAMDEESVPLVWPVPMSSQGHGLGPSSTAGALSSQYSPVPVQRFRRTPPVILSPGGGSSPPGLLSSSSSLPLSSASTAAAAFSSSSIAASASVV